MILAQYAHRAFPAARYKLAQPVTSKGLVLFTVLGLTAICAIFAALLWDDYQEARFNAFQQAGNIAALLEQDIDRNIELYDLSLQAAIDGVTDPEVMNLPPAIRQAVLFDRSATAQGMGSLLVLDESGTIILDSGSKAPRNGNFADRDYFRVHKDSVADIGLYISHPYQSRLRGGDWSIGLSRRYNHPDGSFAGVVLGTMRLEYFKDLFNKAHVGGKGAISLAHMDGMLLMRMPYNMRDIGRDIAAGSLLPRAAAVPVDNYEFTAFDGIRRFYSYRRVANYPLVQCVGLSVDEVMAPWWRKSIATGLSLLGFCVVVLLLMLRSGIELKRRRMAETALAALATVDDLTGIANRRKLDETLVTEWRRAERDDRCFSMLMIDADFFKAYNDAYGHLEGDEVLKAIATRIKAQAGRPGDLAARFGGEEFAVLLPETDYAGARHIGEEIRRGVFDMQFAHARTGSGFVTVSIGVATLRPRHADQPASLVEAADRALYAAKAAGRNIVVGAEDTNVVRFGWRSVRAADSLAAI